MSVHRITLVITPEQRQAASAGVAQVKSSLPPLAELQPGELRELEGTVALLGHYTSGDGELSMQQGLT